MIGRVVSGYRVVAALGAGGMGSVYRAHDELLDRTVALKVLRPELAQQPHVAERFRQEARTLARLLHPHITTLYTLAREGDDLIMVMEFVEGETLEALARRGTAPAEAVTLMAQALDGVAHAHAHGIVHRDLKPANLMRTPEGVVKVMDFGIARLASGGARLTQTRHTVGTLAYMAPEQIRSQEVDARTDVYAAGAMLFELLTGRLPFEADSDFALMQAHLDAPVPAASAFAPAVPEALDGVIRRAMAKDSDDRFPSAEALREALLVAVPDAPTASRPTPVLGPRPTRLAAPIRPTALASSPHALRDRLAERLASVPRVAWMGVGVLAVVLVLGVALWPSPASEAAPEAVAVVEHDAAPGAAAWIDALSEPPEPAASLPELVPLPDSPHPDSPHPEASQPEASRPVAQPSAEPVRAAPEAASPESRAEPEPPRAAATGAVRVLVRPFGDVYVNGRLEARGTNAPVTVALAPGRHRVRVEHPTFGAAERTVTVAAGGHQEVFVSLEPATVTVVSDPVNAAIYVDGRATGRYTPAQLTLPAGAHIVEVRRDGRAPAQQSVRLEAGQSRTLSFTL